ncbi:MAG: alpha/beta hydrolase [Bacteroidota bacterium]
MLLSFLLGILCALFVLLFMIHVGMLSQIISSLQIKKLPDVKQLYQLPDGVEVKIPRGKNEYISSWHKGSGPTVILIHDAGLSSKSLVPLWHAVYGMGHQVITYDLRGHGKSSGCAEGIDFDLLTEDLKSLIDYYNLENFLVIGHSLGSYLTLRLLNAYPSYSGKVNGLLSVAGFAEELGVDAKRHTLFKKLLQAGWLKQLLVYKPYRWAFASSYFGGIPAPPFIAAFLHNFHLGSLKNLISLSEKESFLEQYKWFSGKKIPVWLIHGDSDHINPNVGRSILLPLLSSLTVTRPVEDTGHMLIWESPQEIVDALKLFTHQIHTKNEKALMKDS